MTCSTKVGSLGDLSQYLDAIKHISFLTPDEELKCAQIKDQASIDRLVTAHLALAESLARKFCMQFKPVDYADAIQEANLELLICAQKFNPEEGVRFSTFAISRINYALYALQERGNLVRISTTKSRKKLYYNLSKIKSKILMETGRKSLSEQDISAIAEQLGATEADVRDVDSYISNSDISLNIPIKVDSTSGRVEEIGDQFIARGMNPEQMLGALQHEYISTVGLQEAIDNLSEREATIIRSRFIGNEEELLTLRDLSVMFGISVERVRQIEIASIKKMKSFLDTYEGTGKILATKTLDRVRRTASAKAGGLARRKKKEVA